MLSDLIFFLRYNVNPLHLAFAVPAGIVLVYLLAGLTSAHKSLRGVR